MTTARVAYNRLNQLKQNTVYMKVILSIYDYAITRLFSCYRFKSNYFAIFLWFRSSGLSRVSFYRHSCEMTLALILSS